MKICVTGGDNSGWAIDTDLRLTKLALQQFATLVDDLDDCDFIHCVWPNEYFKNYYKYISGNFNKNFVAVFQGDPIRLFEDTPGFYDFCKKSYCVAQSLDAEKKLELAGMPNYIRIPYIADTSAYYSINRLSDQYYDLKRKYSIPQKKYIIGNFMRDSLGSNLRLPKPEKGPDVFCEIVDILAERVGKRNIHVLLAGPRRHWILRRLREINITVTYVGDESEYDDYPHNILSAAQINNLINLSNLILVSSRSEGGPRVLLEASTCGTPIISTSVGLAQDVLAPECIFDSIPYAVDLIERDYYTQYLSLFTERHKNTVITNHSISAIADRWKQFYNDIYITNNNKKIVRRSFTDNEIFVKVNKRIKGYIKKTKIAREPTLRIWGYKRNAEYNNNSIDSLITEFRKRNIRIAKNESDKADAHFIVSDDVDKDELLNSVKNNLSAPVVQMIYADSIFSQTSFIELDKLAQINSLANITVFESFNALTLCRDRGFEAKNPYIIRSVPDLTFSNGKGCKVFNEYNRIKVITINWNLDKNSAALYQLLDSHIDPNIAEVTLVSNCNFPLKNIKTKCLSQTIDPLNFLKAHDVYINIGSYNTRINGMAEALACGMPVIYSENGGNEEFVGLAGVKLRSPEEINDCLLLLRMYYKNYQNVIQLPNIKDIANKYIELFSFN